MPTVCIDCRYIKSRPSGIAALVRGLITHLPDLAPDWRFLLLRHGSQTGQLSDAPNVQEVRLAAEPNSPATLLWLNRLVDLSGVDLFHATFNILPRKLAMPTVTTVHDIMWLTNPHWCNPRPWGLIERHFHQFGIRRAIAKSDAVAVVSTATKDAILDYEPAAAGKVHVCLSGVDTRFRPSQLTDEDFRRLGLPTRKYVLVVGQHAPYKNHEGALRGFQRAFPSRSDISLVVVHRRSAGLPSLAKLAQRLGLGTRVHIMTEISEDDLVKLYGTASALLHPSLCEGFGNPVAEAMACGTPVVTSNLSAMPEVAGGAAILVNPCDPAEIAEALRKVVDEPDAAKIMRERGLARARELDWKNFAKANLEIYRNVLGVC